MGAELAQHIKPLAKRGTRSFVPEPLACNHGRWGGLYREDGDRKKENRDKKTSETEEDIWRKRKAGDGEGKATHARWKQDLEQTGRVHSCCFWERREYRKIAFFPVS